MAAMSFVVSSCPSSNDEKTSVLSQILTPEVFSNDRKLVEAVDTRITRSRKKIGTALSECEPEKGTPEPGCSLVDPTARL